MARFRTLDDFDFAGRRVLLRADLNVPFKDGAVSDATRIDRLAPTIKELAKKGGRVIVLSHFGRPKGKPDPAMSLGPLAGPLSNALGGQDVAFASDCIGAEAERVVSALGDGDVALLENLRFYPGEEANDPAFAEALAALGDIYVNDAFSAAHRAHASTEALARLRPSAAGRLMQAELEALDKALGAPAHPVAAIVGGAKVSTKLDVLGHLAAKVDLLVIGGAMANTFLAALGTEIGASLCERDLIGSAREIMARAEKAGCEIALPSDVVIAKALVPNAAVETVPVGGVPDDQMILDIGPRSVAAINERLDSCRTLVWNGPLGAFEVPPFDAATLAVARKVAELTGSGKLLSVAGGGDTIAALAAARVSGAISYISTAGGAFLEWLEGKTLPGVAALEQ